jgi:hypothetical protein
LEDAQKLVRENNPNVFQIPPSPSKPIVPGSIPAETIKPIVPQPKIVETTIPIVSETVKPLVPQETAEETVKPLVPEETAVETTNPIVSEEIVSETIKPLVPEETAVETTIPIVSEEIVAETVEPLVPEETAVETTIPIVSEEIVAETVKPIVQEEKVAETVKPLVPEEKVVETVKSTKQIVTPEEKSSKPLNVAENKVVDYTYNKAPGSAEAEPIEKYSGLFYTVQIGVFNLPASDTSLFKIDELMTQRLPTGQIKYTTGMYNSFEEALVKKRSVIDKGVKDAFIIAYNKGNRINLEDAQKLVRENNPNVFQIPPSPSKPIVPGSIPAETIKPIVPQPKIVETTIPIVSEEIVAETVKPPVPEETAVETTNPIVPEKTAEETANPIVSEEIVTETVKPPVPEETAEETANPIVSEVIVAETVKPIVSPSKAVETVMPKKQEVPELKIEEEPINTVKSSEKRVKQPKDVLENKLVEYTYNQAPDAAEAEPIEKYSGLFFTIQLGVFNRPATASSVYNVDELMTLRLPNGQIKYTAGMYNSFEDALVKKQNVIEKGIKDPFITAYYKGSRITLDDAQQLIIDNGKEVLQVPIPTSKPIGVNDIKPKDIINDREGKISYTESSEENNLKEQRIQIVTKMKFDEFPREILNRYNSHGSFYYDESDKRVKSVIASSAEELPDVYYFKDAIDTVYLKEVFNVQSNRISVTFDSSRLPGDLIDWLFRLNLRKEFKQSESAIELIIFKIPDYKLNQIEVKISEFGLDYKLYNDTKGIK